MNRLLLLPPITFLIVLAFWLVQLRGLSIFSAGLKKPTEGGAFKSYGCGEDIEDSRVQPDYRQFFPFAFFFTIMHVVAMVVATVPLASVPATLFASIYIFVSATGLLIMFRR